MNLIQKALSMIVGRVEQIGFRDDTAPRSYAGVPVTETSVMSLSAGWACVNLHAGLTAMTPFKVYATDDKRGLREIDDHPLCDVFLKSPNADQDPFMFFEGAQIRLELRGNVCAEIHRSSAGITALTPILNPTIQRNRDGELVYTWSENGQQRRETQDKVWHVRGFGGDALGGLSTVAYGSQVFGLNTAVNIAAQKTFANGMRPSGVVTFDKFLTKEQRPLIEAQMHDKYVGAMNAGKPFVLEGGSTWTPVNFTPEDAQMLQSRGFGVEEACRLFGVPPFMVGHNEKSSGYPASLEQQILLFERFHFAKRPTRIAFAARKQLLTPRDRALGVTVLPDLEALRQGDSAGRAAFYKAMTEIGAFTINEVRKREHMPPVDGGDVPRMQMQNVPISETLHPKPVATH